MGSKQELQSLPGVTTNVDPATKDFIFQQVGGVGGDRTEWVICCWNVGCGSVPGWRMGA